MLDPHPGMIAWTIITFLVVLFILKSTVWKPLLAALEEREQRIADALTAGDKARNEAEEILVAHRRKLEAVQEEGHEIVRQAREAAEKIHQRIVDEARIEAQNTLDMALRSIQAEKQAAMEELRGQVADLAIQAAGVVLEANLDDDSNRKLVDDLIAGISPSSAREN